MPIVSVMNRILELSVKVCVIKIPKIELKRLSSFGIEQISLFSVGLGLVDPHRLLTWVWSTPKQANPLICGSEIVHQPI